MNEAVAALREAGHADAILWVLADNPPARCFYEREGWTPDGATKSEEWLGLAVAEVRYRRALPPAERTRPGPGPDTKA